MAKSKLIISLFMALGMTLLVQASDEVQSEPRENTIDFNKYKMDRVQDIFDRYIEEYQIKLTKEQEVVLLNKKLILEENKVKEPHFNPYDVTELSGLNKEQIYKMLENTDLATLVDALYWYEQEYKINLIFITSIVALESGWGRSSLAISHNNLSGYTDGNGGYYAFDSWGASLEETFRLIGEEYTREEGLFYNGKSVWNVNLKYCELDNWSEKVISIGNELLLNVNK